MSLNPNTIKKSCPLHISWTLRFSFNLFKCLLQCRCAEPIRHPCQLKVTGQGHWFEPWISCPLHISYMEGFSLNFGHIFASVRRCAELIPQPCRHKVKITVQGHRFEPWISCPLSISYTSGRIFFKLWSKVHLSETMCRINNSTMPTQGKGHSSRSCLSLEFRVGSVSPLPLGGFSLNFGQMFTLVIQCAEPITQPCWLTVKVKVQGHRF